MSTFLWRVWGVWWRLMASLGVLMLIGGIGAGIIALRLPPTITVVLVTIYVAAILSLVLSSEED